MHRNLIALLVISIVLTETILIPIALLAPAAVLSIPTSGGIIAVSASLTLHVDGRWIRDSNENVIYLRGVSGGTVSFVDRTNGNWIAVGATGPSASWNPQAVKDNLDVMRRWGVNVIRSLITPYYWKFNTNNFRQNIKDLLTWAGERGIYVLLEGYQVLPYSISQRSMDALPYPPFQSSSAAYDPALTQQIIGSEQDYIDWMAQMASELANYPSLIIGLWNEPHPGDASNDPNWSLGAAAFASWVGNVTHTGVVARTVDAIRKAGSQNLIVVQWNYGVSVNWNSPSSGEFVNDWISSMNLTGKSNIAYATHMYRESGAYGTAASRRWTIDDIRQCFVYEGIPWVGETFGAPLLITEIGSEDGSSSDDGHNFDAFSNALTVLNEMRLGYLAWWWSNWSGGRVSDLLQSGSFVPPPTRSGQTLQTKIVEGTNRTTYP